MDFEQTPLLKAFQPLFLAMSIFGLHHSSCSATEHEPKVSKMNWSGVQQSASKYYATFITLLMGFNVLRLFTAFEAGEKFGYSLFFKIILILWFANVSLNYFSFYSVSEKTSTINSFWNQWGEIQRNKADDKVMTPGRLVKFSVIMIFTTLLFNSVLFSYAIFYTDMLAPLLAPYRGEYFGLWDSLIRIGGIVAQVFGMAGWLLPIALLINLCKSIITFSLYFYPLDYRGHHFPIL